MSLFFSSKVIAAVKSYPRAKYSIPVFNVANKLYIWFLKKDSDRNLVKSPNIDRSIIILKLLM